MILNYDWLITVSRMVGDLGRVTPLQGWGYDLERGHYVVESGKMVVTVAVMGDGQNPVSMTCKAVTPGVVIERDVEIEEAGVLQAASLACQGVLTVALGDWVLQAWPQGWVVPAEKLVETQPEDGNADAV